MAVVLLKHTALLAVFATAVTGVTRILTQPSARAQEEPQPRHLYVLRLCA